MKKSNRTSYSYSFPKELIAQKPVSPRDAARLLVYRKSDKSVSISTFKNLSHFLPRDAVIVFNETKVIPARLFVRKETGGVVEVLYIEKEKNLIKVLADRKLECGARIHVDRRTYFTVMRSDGRFYFLKPSFPSARLDDVLDRYGHAPVPPYIRHSKKMSMRLRGQYQTIFARTRGSIAAPTASLHFTKRLVHDLERHGNAIRFITLHVGLGTFAPVTEQQLKKKKLHEEFYSIDRGTLRFLNRAKREGRPIIAVGTTVVRTLESACRGKRLERASGSTNLFIQPGYRFKFVDGIITNFHVPHSSLLMLVSAFVGRNELLKFYTKAIKKKFRLFSFGDGMLMR